MASKRARIGAVLKALADNDLPGDETPAGALLHRLRGIVLGPNVVGFAATQKYVGDAPVDVASATFFVERKMPADVLVAADAIPPVIIDHRGTAILTDVIETGPLELHLQAGPDPIRSGFSIAHVGGDPGTLAAIVRKNGARCALSAQHVLANLDRGAPGDAILFPAIADGGTAANRIGTLAPYAPLVPGDDFPNEVDAALCVLDPAALARIDAAIPGAAQPIGMADPVRGAAVRLSGRTSGFVTGTVGEINAFAILKRNGVAYGFRGLGLCPRFGAGGDSGALVIDVASGKAVGIHIGGSPVTSFFVPIRRAAKALGFVF